MSASGGGNSHGGSRTAGHRAGSGRAGDAPRLSAVAIGASAGGVEALGVLLPALPAGFGRAVLVVMHLPADRPSRLAELFARRCALPVREALDKEQLESGTVYVAPPGYHLQVEPGGWLSLSVDEPVHHARPSIDVLFESAAHAFGARLLGVVLTGANADGAAGLRAIRRAGGAAWVQAPETAQHPAMPRAALALAGADRVLALEPMAQALRELPAADRPAAHP